MKFEIDTILANIEFQILSYERVINMQGKRPKLNFQMLFLYFLKFISNPE